MEDCLEFWMTCVMFFGYYFAKESYPTRIQQKKLWPRYLTWYSFLFQVNLHSFKYFLQKFSSCIYCKNNLVTMLIFLKYMQTEKTSSYERNMYLLKHFPPNCTTKCEFLYKVVFYSQETYSSLMFRGYLYQIKWQLSKFSLSIIKQLN